MARFPEDLNVVNRIAVRVSPTSFFIAWVDSITPDDPVTDDVGGTTYLLPVFEGDIYEIKEFVDKHFKFFFEHELHSWYTDKTLWPKRLTRKKFYEWFDVEVSDMVFDTAKENLDRE